MCAYINKSIVLLWSRLLRHLSLGQRPKESSWCLYGTLDHRDVDLGRDLSLIVSHKYNIAHLCLNATVTYSGNLNLHQVCNLDLLLV